MIFKFMYMLGNYQQLDSRHITVMKWNKKIAILDKKLERFCVLHITLFSLCVLLKFKVYTLISFTLLYIASFLKFLFILSHLSAIYNFILVVLFYIYMYSTQLFYFIYKFMLLYCLL